MLKKSLKPPKEPHATPNAWNSKHFNLEKDQWQTAIEGGIGILPQNKHKGLQKAKKKTNQNQKNKQIEVYLYRTKNQKQIYKLYLLFKLKELNSQAPSRRLI